MTTVELRTRVYGGYAVVVVRGELDITEAESVADVVAVLAADGQQLIVDLEALDFIDCHAAGALLGCGRRRGRPAVMCCWPRRTVRCCGC
jgi:anti-anti-sigma factor